MNLRNIKQLIKKQDTWVSRTLFHMYQQTRNIRLPSYTAIKWIFISIYNMQIFISSVINVCFKIFYIEPVIRVVCKEVGRGLKIERLPYIRGHGAIQIGHDVHLSGLINIQFGSQLADLPKVVIGSNTFIGHGFSARISESLSIGENCYIAGNVKIFDIDGHPQDYRLRREGKPVGAESIAPVCIGDDVWIGTNVIILKGVSIGSRSIVGAGSVVVKDIAPDVIASGNPARVIKLLGE